METQHTQRSGIANSCSRGAQTRENYMTNISKSNIWNRQCMLMNRLNITKSQCKHSKIIQLESWTPTRLALNLHHNLRSDWALISTQMASWASEADFRPFYLVPDLVPRPSVGVAGLGRGGGGSLGGGMSWSIDCTMIVCVLQWKQCLLRRLHLCVTTELSCFTCVLQYNACVRGPAKRTISYENVWTYLYFAEETVFAENTGATFVSLKWLHPLVFYNGNAFAGHVQTMLSRKQICLVSLRKGDESHVNEWGNSIRGKLWCVLECAIIILNRNCFAMDLIYFVESITVFVCSQAD